MTSTITDNDRRASDVALSCRHIDYHKSPTEPLATGTAKIAQYLIAIVTLPLWSFWLQMYYEWFVVPIFNTPHITLWQGAGLGLMAAMLRYRMGSFHVSQQETIFRCIEDFTAPTIGLAMGWLFAHFVLGVA